MANPLAVLLSSDIRFAFGFTHVKAQSIRKH